jgi:hypothetical protein
METKLENKNLISNGWSLGLKLGKEAAKVNTGLFQVQQLA